MTRPPVGRASGGGSGPSTWPGWRAVALVFAGGALGSTARAALLAASATTSTWPAGVLVVNVVGSFLLGALVGVLVRVRSARRSDALRLFLGTGVLGGFTTYSALAGDTVSLATSGDVLVAIIYPVVSVIAGIAAAFAGAALASASVGRARR